MEQNLRFGLVLHWLAVLKIAQSNLATSDEFKLKYNDFGSHLNLTLTQKNKNPESHFQFAC